MAFDIEAHRGGRALRPENTLASFANALSMGVDTLELDIGVTADGALVVSHERGLNPDLARGPDGAYVAAPGIPFVRLPLAEVKKYDVGRIRPDSAYAKQFPDQHAVPGTPIPTLSEVFALVRKSGDAPCAPQHRNQDRSQPSGRIPRPAAFCHPAARSRRRREIRGPHHGAVVRLAHVAARAEARARDSHGLSHPAEGQRADGVAGQEPPNGPRASIPPATAARCRAPSRTPAARSGRLISATSRRSWSRNPTASGSRSWSGPSTRRTTSRA